MLLPIQPSYFEEEDDADSVFEIALIGEDADHVVVVEQPGKSDGYLPGPGRCLEG